MNILDKNKYAEVWRSLDAVTPAAGFIVTAIHLGKVLNETGETSLFAPFDLSTSEFEALFIIDQKSKCRPTEVSRHSVMQPAKITRVLDKLEKKMLITRTALKTDRRAYNLELTEEGAKRLKAAVKAFAAGTESLTQNLGAGKIRELNTVLRTILYSMGESK